MLLTGIICVAAVIRLRLLDLPLERDEGEYAYAGQLMLQGIPPYQLAYNMKLPGTYAAYALIMALFGQTIRGIHLGLIVANAITIVLVYFLGRRLFGQICGLVAAGCYTLMSLSSSVFGLAAHATHFVVAFAIAAMLLLLDSLKTDRPFPLFCSGLLFGLAFITKQPGVFFGVFGGLVILEQEVRRRPFLMNRLLRRLSIFGGGALLPMGLVVGLLSAAGVLQQFWFWTFGYAREYAAILTLSEGWDALKENGTNILLAGAGIWILAAVGLVVSLSCKSTRSTGLFTLGFLGASFATVCPGYYFREHYFITLLPAVALFAGAGVEVVWRQAQSKPRGSTWLTAILSVGVLIAFGQMLFHHRNLFFRLSPSQAARTLYGENPFPEAIEIGNYIREHSTPDARVAVIGSEPEIYFYSHRHSATGYIYMYPLMESQRYAAEMQRQASHEIEQAKPDFLVVVAVSWSWMRQPTSNTEILKWTQEYIQAEFEEAGLIDLKRTENTVYRWGEQAVAAIPRSKNYVQVFKRRDFSY